MDFTHKAYGQLLDSFIKSGYRVVTVREYLEGNKDPYTLILRHDVEWNPKRALDIANLEHSRGFHSTLYFRADTKAFDLELMRYLQRLGFEIGYHFNTLDRCNGDFEKAVILFEEELRKIRDAGIDIKTVCSHGDPRVEKKGYKVNNEIFLRYPELYSKNNILGEAYLSINFPSLTYISDVGIRWNKASSTKELMLRFISREWPVVYVLTHPDYWSPSFMRAMGLKVAAKGIKAFKVNKTIIWGKKLISLPRRFLSGN
ncbi:hypothetical protein [Acetomicrobium sp.]|uniref:hypothetical protein n=1 Tax=Acetomicrobium sp. TaxID=1872099 RepID=UPI002FCA3C6A